MKKSLVIILAVAIIGGAGVVARHKENAAPAAAPSSQNQTASSITNTTPVSTGSSSTTYKDGIYSGASEDTPYGTVQVAIVVSGGKITDVSYLQMPGPEGHSKEVSAFSEPLLKQATIQNQNSKIDFVSGATTTSEAYQQSLQAALNQATLS